jgi:hypothetical protein
MAQPGHFIWESVVPLLKEMGAGDGGLYFARSLAEEIDSLTLGLKGLHGSRSGVFTGIGPNINLQLIPLPACNSPGKISPSIRKWDIF